MVIDHPRDRAHLLSAVVSWVTLQSCSNVSAAHAARSPTTTWACVTRPSGSSPNASASSTAPSVLKTTATDRKTTAMARR